jgi:polysaccharide deacetylase family protein (PEP-CTERM system associated)
MCEALRMTPDTRSANLLSFDIEGFIEASHDSMHVPSKYVSDELEREEIHVNTVEILNVLAETDQKATFFVLGRIARDMPSLVRDIAGAGHELACHSLYHRRLFLFSPNEVRSFLSEAKSLLEDASGQAVYGFRAPDFSITESNTWTFDILRELGFKYDSSVYPISVHDAYGMGHFPQTPFVLPNGLVEFPMSTVRILGTNIPFGGGGYLRLYPLILTKLFFRRLNKRGVPVIVYLHPSEMGRVVRRIRELSPLRQWRTYVGFRTARPKLRSLLRTFRFIRMIDYLREQHIPANSFHSTHDLLEEPGR